MYETIRNLSSKRSFNSTVNALICGFPFVVAHPHRELLFYMQEYAVKKTVLSEPPTHQNALQYQYHRELTRQRRENYVSAPCVPHEFIDGCNGMWRAA